MGLVKDPPHAQALSSPKDSNSEGPGRAQKSLGLTGLPDESRAGGLWTL